MNRHIPSFFDKQGLQLLLFGGKGGVGKTTCATAAALRLAAQAQERSLLLVSTDPAHSVRDSLAGCVPPGNLQVLELDAQQCLTKFRDQNGGMRSPPGWRLGSTTASWWIPRPAVIPCGCWPCPN
jgi:arsenite-transporting ATPase